MRSKPALSAVIALAALGVACEDEIVYGTPSEVSAQADVDAGPGVVEAGPPKLDFQEAEFAESDRSRDPFRSFAGVFVDEARTRSQNQREIILNQYGVDELRLVGIVTGIHPAKAMLVDPTGKGHVIQRGQFVGRPEVVSGGAGSGASYEITWRVDRIRDGDIVLIREDAKNPDVPSATRVIPLRPEGTVVDGE